jgi:hypothetical protein
MNGKSMGFSSVIVTVDADEVIIKYDESEPPINGFHSLMLTKKAAIDLQKQLTDLLAE